ncbi:MAG: ABC transporter ATP-binding protein [Verrucomicrobiota bacterium]
MSSKSNNPPARKLTFRETLREMWGPYKQLLPYLRPYRSRFISGILCGAGAGITSGLLGLVIKHVSGQVFPGGKGNHGAHAANGIGIETIAWTCALIPAAMLLRSTLAYLNAYCMAWVSLRLLNDIRNDLFKSIVNQSLAFFNKQQTGQLISRVMNDARMAQMALTTVSADVVTQPVTIVSAIAMLIHLDWRFTVISLVLFPVCLIPITVFGRNVRRVGRDEETGSGNMMVVLQEAFSGIRVVKALAREPYELVDFMDAGKHQFRSAIRVRRSIEIVGPIIEAVSSIGVCMALIYVGVRGIPAGTFLGLITGLFMLYEPVKKLSKVHLQIQKALSSTTRIFELMTLEHTVKDAPDALSLERPRGEISLENVTFGYREDRPPAVQDITLRIAQGKSYALVGASGAGKSTILSLILRFYDPQSGVIRVDGHDLRSVTQQSLRQNVGIVTQDTFLFHTTILENIRYGRLNATDEEVYAAAEQAFAHEFICAQPEGYQTSIGDKGCMLSGGQQQRIAIARALLRNAPILLLDEATSALDSESEQKIQIALERLSAGRTVIAIAHRLSTILKADQIVVMEQGRIMEVGTHAELFEKSGHYRRLYDLQFNRTENESLELVG